jgi:hypothetical protein
MFKNVLCSLMLLVMTGCINENRDDCQPLPLGWVPAYDVSIVPQLGGNSIPDDIKSMQLYVFDDNGVLQQIVNASPEDVASGNVKLNLPDGKYTVVAVGNSSTNPAQGGFDSSKAEVGKTTLDDFKLVLATKPITDGRDGAVEPTDKQLGNLYESITELTVNNTGGQKPVLALDFKSVTSKFQIHISGMPVGHMAEAYIISPDALLNADGSLAAGSPNVRYEPSSKAAGDQTYDADFKTVHMTLAQQSTNPTMLHLKYTDANGQVVEKVFNLTNYVATAKDAQGNLLYPTQADIDKAEVFVIDIALEANSTIVISVNGFGQTENLTPEVEKA